MYSMTRSPLPISDTQNLTYVLITLGAYGSSNMSPFCSLLFQIAHNIPRRLSHGLSFRGDPSPRRRQRHHYFLGEPVSSRQKGVEQNFLRTAPCARAKNDPPKPRHDWGGLIREFEARANASEHLSDPPPPGAVLDEEDADELETLPIVETAACTALTFIMWYLGRIWRLDSFLLLFYPIPMFFITMRWGPKVGDRVLVTTLFCVLTMMGPLYCLLYFLNTGIMGLVFSRVLWYRWHWFPAVIAGGLAKGVGLTLQFTWMSSVVKYNSWLLIGEQVKMIAETTFSAVYGVLRIKTVPTLQLSQIQVAIAVVLGLHSALHVLSTYLASTMILDRIGESVKLQRQPRMLKFLATLKERVQQQRQFYD